MPERETDQTGSTIGIVLGCAAVSGPTLALTIGLLRHLSLPIPDGGATKNIGFGSAIAVGIALWGRSFEKLQWDRIREVQGEKPRPFVQKLLSHVGVVTGVTIVGTTLAWASGLGGGEGIILGAVIGGVIGEISPHISSWWESRNTKIPQLSAE